MNKVNLKLILWTANPKPDGSLPIYIRITISRKTTYIATSYSIHASFWDENKERVKDKHQDAGHINTDLQQKVTELTQAVVKANVEGRVLTASMLKTMHLQKSDANNIFDFFDDFTAEVKSKRSAGTLVNNKKHLHILQEYHGSRNLIFQEIDHKYLGAFERWLREEQKFSGNYVHTIFKDLKMIFNAAKRRKVTDHYPFDTYEFPVYVSPTKDYLTTEELKRWERFADNAADPVLKQTAIWFLFGCYTGLRVSDWYQFKIEKHVHGNVIRLWAKKNGKYVTMPISRPLARNLKRMEEVPLTIKEPTLNEKLKEIAKRDDVAIDKHLTTHTGRHTFAVTICLGNGVSSETAAELMGITLNTFVDNYSQVTEEKIERETRDAWARLK